MDGKPYFGRKLRNRNPKRKRGNRGRRFSLADASLPRSRFGLRCARFGKTISISRGCKHPPYRISSALFTGLAALAVITSPALAQRNDGLPKELEGVGVTEHRDAQVPVDLEFIASDGRKVTLGEYFDGTRPVVLTLNYSNCPKLCSIQLNGLVDAMRKMPWDLGKEYRVLTVGIDPLETPERAQLTRQSYLQRYGRAGGAAGWHFVVGREENIKRLAEVVGFGYAYLPESKQYVHAAVLIICMPDGRISRYIYKVHYDPQTLRLSLFEAGEGKVGSPMDQILLFCFHYDSASGRYGPAAFNLMRAAGGVTVLVLGAMLSVYWLREKRKTTKA